MNIPHVRKIFFWRCRQSNPEKNPLMCERCCFLVILLIGDKREAMTGFGVIWGKIRVKRGDRPWWRAGLWVVSNIGYVNLWVGSGLVVYLIFVFVYLDTLMNYTVKISEIIKLDLRNVENRVCDLSLITYTGCLR